MASVVIPTARLDLVLQTPEEALAWVESMDPADRAELSPDWIARVRSTPPGDPKPSATRPSSGWAGRPSGRARSRGRRTPTASSRWPTASTPDYRGRGLATEAAGALAGFAFASGLVRVVRAHTRPDNPASIRVLEKCGFRRLGEVMDP